MANNRGLQFLRGNIEEDRDSIELLEGQPFYDKDNNRLYVGHGDTTIRNSEYLFKDDFDALRSKDNAQDERMSVIEGVDRSQNTSIGNLQTNVNSLITRMHGAETVNTDQTSRLDGIDKRLDELGFKRGSMSINFGSAPSIAKLGKFVIGSFVTSVLEDSICDGLIDGGADYLPLQEIKIACTLVVPSGSGVYSGSYFPGTITISEEGYITVANSVSLPVHLVTVPNQHIRFGYATDSKYDTV